jgi:GT2 family glycosyltransferase/thioredoxin-like negative regulator of GroEL
MNNSHNPAIYFACLTEFHVLVAFILSQCVYSTEPKVLILASSRAVRFEQAARALGIWVEVRVQGTDDLGAIEIATNDILHFFTFGLPAYNLFFARFAAQGGKIYLTDEGTLTYHPAVLFEHWSSQSALNSKIAEGFSIDAISEYWLGNPDVFCEKTQVPLRRISFEEFIAQAQANPVLYQSLMQLFGLRAPHLVIEKDLVYFQQYAAETNLLPRSIDQTIDETIQRVIAPLTTFTKLHPALNTYSGSDEYSWLINCPWEVNLLLARIQSKPAAAKIFISLSSSAMHNTMGFYPDAAYIYLYRLMDSYAGRKESAMDAIVTRLIKAYPKAKIYRPSHWGELRQVMQVVGKRFHCAFNFSALPFAPKLTSAAAPTNTVSVALRKLKQAVQQKNWAYVEAASKELLARKPDYTEVALYLALALINTQRIVAGKNLLQQILAAHPENITVTRALVDADFDTGEFDRVIGFAIWLLPHFPEDLGLRKRLAVALQQQKAVEDAFWVNESIYRLAPSDHEALNILVSQGMVSRSLTARAHVYAEKALALRPHDPMMSFRYAVLFMEQSDFKSAEQAFREAIEKSSTKLFPEAENGLALALLNQGRWLESRRVFEALIHNAPEFTHALTGYAKLLEVTGTYSESIAQLPKSTAEQVKNILSQQPGMPYELWIETVEPLTQLTPESLQSELAQWREPPLISVLLPTFNSDISHLMICIESVVRQSYPHWTLCIADDASTDSRIREVLLAYAEKDRRIQLIFRTENGHISQASNSALELAAGEFVALLDHDDALAEHALFFVAKAILAHPSARIFYSDEDMIDDLGHRTNPHLKSDWNPDLFFSQNYVSHLVVYARDLLNLIGGFRTGVEGSQDQDLLLRCLPHTSAEQIIHIPHVLYHQRTKKGSTVTASDANNNTDAGIKALKDYFEENGPKGVHVEAGSVPNTYRVRWPIPSPEPLVSLLIPTRDAKTITELAVRSILDKTAYTNYEILILDNGSVAPETHAWFDAIRQEDGRVQVLRYDHPFNYSAINNFGVMHAKGSIIGLINNDIEVINPDWLTEMVSQALRDDIGCVGAKLYYSNQTVQHGGVIVGLGGVAAHSHLHYARDDPGYFSRLKLVQNLSAVTAACLLVRKAIYEEVGGLNETQLTIAFNDVDFCLKVRAAGYRNLWTPYAELYHYESLSRGYEDTAEKKARFLGEAKFMQSTWGETLKRDPYYNPNLTQMREDFSIGSVREALISSASTQ